MDAGDDIGEIVRHAQRQDRKGFLPSRRGEPFFGDRLASDVQPNHFVAQQKAVMRDRGLTVL